MNTYRVLYKKTFPKTGETPVSVEMKDYDEVTSLTFGGPVGYPSGSVNEDLEMIFRDMNAVDGDETCCKLKVRSMSVGDVVIDASGNAHYCAHTGWTKVEMKVTTRFDTILENVEA